MGCLRCSDTGFFNAPDKSFADGSTIFKCGCQFSTEDMGITPLYQDASFNHYTIKKTAKWFEDYINNFKVVDMTHDRGELKQIGVYIWGGVGCGKSYLSCATLIELSKNKGVRGLFVDVTELIEIGRARSLNNEEARDKFESIKNKELLVIDDIGTEKLTDWVEPFLFSLIHYRYVQWLPTIFTTNVSIEAFPARFLKENVGDRITSRINVSCFILELTSSDYRQTLSKIKPIIQ